MKRAFCRIIFKSILCFFFAFLIVTASVELISTPFASSAVNGEKQDLIGVCARISNGFYQFEERICISDYNVLPEQIGDIFVSIIKNDPYLFFVDNHLSYSYRKNGYVIELIPRYKVSYDEANKQIEYCRAEIGRIVSEISKLGGELERVLSAHDYLCKNYHYDMSLENDNIYKFLMNGSGNCQGYTWAYMAILREIGVESEYVASDTVNHIWNLVKLDGEWYHCDVTWDDPISDEDNSLSISRKHFLCSDKKTERQGHIDWYSANGTVCTSEKYDSFDFDKAVHSWVLTGDADHSGKLELIDLLFCKETYVSGICRSKICFECMDADRDGFVSRDDLSKMRTELLGGQ